jgi:heme/copper-type cytochrome/quinol oxidase subunit 2
MIVELISIVLVLILLSIGSVYVSIALKDFVYDQDEEKNARKYALIAASTGWVVFVVLIVIGVILIINPEFAGGAIFTMVLVLAILAITACGILTAMAASYVKSGTQYEANKISYDNLVNAALIYFIPVIILTVGMIFSIIHKSIKRRDFQRRLAQEGLKQI